MWASFRMKRGIGPTRLAGIGSMSGMIREVMEQSGFRSDQEMAYKGAKYGWQNFIGGLERVLGGLE